MKIGFIGLGIMGKPMAANLLHAGFSVAAYDRFAATAVQETAAKGATAAQTIAEACAEADVIITMLPGGPQVREVALGDEGISKHARKGALVIDMSSVSPEDSRFVGAQLAESGLRFLDAPVSGGEPGAIEATLTIMCGGKQTDFEEAYPLFLTMGRAAVLVGEQGAGSMAKLANQIIVATNIAAVAEAFCLASKAGLDPELVFNAIRGGLAGSAVLEAKLPMMIERNFQPGGRIDIHAKDLKNALAAGQSLECPLLLTSEIYQMMLSLQANGQGKSDHSALALFLEQIAGTKIEKVKL